MTNFEYIKSMTAKEFFNFISELELYKCNGCPVKNKCGEGEDHSTCSENFISWLNSERSKYDSAVLQN